MTPTKRVLGAGADLQELDSMSYLQRRTGTVADGAAAGGVQGPGGLGKKIKVSFAAKSQT